MSSGAIGIKLQSLFHLSIARLSAISGKKNSAVCLSPERLGSLEGKVSLTIDEKSSMCSRALCCPEIDPRHEIIPSSDFIDVCGTIAEIFDKR